MRIENRNENIQQQQKQQQRGQIIHASGGNTSGILILYSFFSTLFACTQCTKYKKIAANCFNFIVNLIERENALESNLCQPKWVPKYIK